MTFTTTTGTASAWPPPRGPVRLVIDTDTANEIDDQFALVRAPRCPQLDVVAVYAELFSFAHRRAQHPTPRRTQRPSTRRPWAWSAATGEAVKVYELGSVAGRPGVSRQRGLPARVWPAAAQRGGGSSDCHRP